MARAFNLTAELNLRGPSNVRLIVADIRRQLGSITADVDVRVNPATSRNLGALNATLTNLNQTLTRTQNNANAVTAAFNNMGRTIGAFNTNVNNAQRNVQNLTTATNTLNTNLTQANRQARQTGNEFEEFGRQSALAVRRFAAFATVTSVIYKFTNALSGATQEFIDFNRELVRVAQVTDSALKDLNPLVNEITRLSTGLGVTSQDLIQVSSTLAQAGLSARDTEKALKALALSALAPSFDNLNETVEGSIALMRQFGISAGDLQDALGSVNAVAAKFAVEASDLITAVQRTGGVFATASKGVSEGKDALNEFLAVFTSIRQTTRESAETIATGLRTIFTRLQRESTIDALKGLGIELRNAQGQFVGAFEAVKRLSQGLSQIDPRSKEFAAISEELGGFRQIGKVIPLIQQFAVAQQALKVAQQGQGSLARDAATAQQSVANQLVKVREEFNALIRSIGQSESFQTFVKLSLDLTSALIKLADSAKSVLPAITAIAAIRGASAIGSFATGFVGGLRRQNSGGYIRRFASGGLVPGSGNTDTVPAMLTPGEFVIRKNAVKAIGADSLQGINKYAVGGAVQQLNKRSTLGIRKGARSKFKELSETEIAKLSTADLIKYAKDQAYDIFSTGGAGMATGMKFISVPPRKITPELEPHLDTYLGKKGFWREQISPFGRPNKNVDQAKKKVSREEALKKQESRMADEVAARSQQWQNIRAGSSIDSYLQSTLKDPILSDYKSARSGGTLAKPFHNTRLRKAVNDALEAYDDFDYSPGNIDKLVSAFAAKQFALGGNVQKFDKGGMAERKIKKNMGYGGEGVMQFGLVGLRSGLSDTESLPSSMMETQTTPKNRKVQLNVGTLAKSYKQEFADQIEQDMYQSFAGTVVKTGSSLAQKIGANTKPNQAKIDKVLKGSGFTTVVGAALESALGLIGSPYMDKTEATKSLDFPFGLGKAGGLFGINGKIPTDVTRTIGGVGKGTPQILGQIDRFIDATESGEFSKAIRDKIRGKSLGQTTSMLTAIKDSVGSKSITETIGAANANALLAKYGLSKIALKKQSLIKEVSGLSVAQQRSFASDLRGYIGASPVRKATGGSVEDTVPALLTPGEFVINKKAASRIGSSKLHQLNRADKIQGFNKGGSVGPIQRFAIGGSVDAGMNQEVYRLAKQLMKNGLAMADALSQARERVEKAYAPAGPALGAKATKDSLSYGAKTPSGTTLPAQPITRNVDDIQADRNQRRLAKSQERQKQQMAAGFAQYEESQSYAGKAKTYAEKSSSAKSPIAQDFYAGLSKLNQTLANSNGTLSQFKTSISNAYQGTVQFASQIKANPLGMLAKAASQTANSLYSAARSGARGVGGMISGVGGSVLGSLGLGRFASGRGAAGGGGAGGATGGGMGGGMASMALAMGGGLAVESLSKAYGGESTDTGRMVGSVGSNALNYGATGAAIGSMIPVVGTALGGLVGAAAGVVIGFQEAEKAGQEYAVSQNKAAAEVASGKSSKALQQYTSDNTLSNRRAFIASFASTSEAEAKTNASMKRERASSFGKMLGYSDEDIETFSQKKAATEQAGADQAAQFLATEMMNSGKTFDQISKSMNPAEFQMLAKNMAEADSRYIMFQEKRANEISKLREQGKTDPSKIAEADRLQEQTNKESAVMAENLARRQLAETSAAAQAKAVAEANKKLAKAAEEAAESLTERFAKASSALDLVSVAMKAAADRSKEIASGRSSSVSIGFNTDLARMKNDAVPIQQRKSLMGRYAGRLGETGQQAMRVVDFADNAKKAAKEAAANVNSGGTIEQQNEQLGSSIERSLVAQINATFGPGSTMANTLIAGVKTSVDKMVKGADGVALSAEQILEDASGPLVKASEDAGNLLIKQAEKLAEAFELISNNSEEIANIEQEQKDRLVDLNDKIRLNAMAYTEAIGGRVNSRERINNRLARVGDTVGMRRGTTVNAANIIKQVGVLQNQQTDLRKKRDDAQAAGNVNAVANFDRQLKATEKQLNSTKNALNSLPDALQEGINDVLSEIQQKVADIEARKEAGAGFAEKLVGSTPQELFDLNRTYALMNNTLRGNITTIQQSVDAQQAYLMALQNGKTQQEAYADAQIAFANKNKEALSLFNELTQVAGIKGPQFDVMRADLLENFAKAQGSGLDSNPMFREIIAELRRSPEERAKRDPTIQALTTLFGQLQTEQQKTVAAINIVGDQQVAALQGQTKDIVDAINAGAPGQGLARGGMVYASRGRFINFQPKGTDTVPAMLTPGEFVVNAKSTKNNLPLLQSINNGYYNNGGKVQQQSGSVRNTRELLQSSLQNTMNRLQQTAQQNQIYGLAKGFYKKPNIIPAGSGTSQPLSIEDTGNGQQNKQNFINAVNNAPVDPRDFVTSAFYNDVRNNKFKLINSQQYARRQFLAYQKLSPEEKIVAEFYQQKNMQPEAFGPNAFLLDENEYVTKLEQALMQKDVKELYRAKSKRGNYLREILGNLNIAGQMISTDNPARKEFAEQFKNANIELGILERSWRALQIKRAQPPLKNAGELLFPQLQNMNSFEKDQTKNFNPMNPPPAKQYFARGGTVYANNGALIPFAPKGSDTVPAMLTPGEFVVNKSASQRNLGLLQAINSGQYSNGGKVSYLAEGTPGVDAFSTSIKMLTDAITIGVDKINMAFIEATRQLNGTSGTNDNSPINRNTTATQNGVSNNTVANIDILGSKLDRFIEQLQAAIPPIIKVEGKHDVNVVINGATALQNLMQGPLSSLIQSAIQFAFNAKSRENEGN